LILVSHNLHAILIVLFYRGSPSKTVVVSGAQVKEKDAFSTEAVKNMHEKPMPTVGHSNIHAHNANHIQQPRKN